MPNRFPLRQFKEQYGTHDQWLDALKVLRFPDNTPCPKCNKETVFYRVTNRSSYACKRCGWHVYPLAGTIFEKTSTPLDLWFFAMYLMVQTRSGTSAKQLERMLGVTYKTAWRMFKQIRMLMAQGGLPLDGIVEIDETFIGGKGENRAYKPHFNEKEKAIVMGMIQRGGSAYFKRIKTTGKWALLEQIQQHISLDARIITDELPGYTQLRKLGYGHATIKHGAREYVKKVEALDLKIHTNNIEGFWSDLKRGIYGVYRQVSNKYLQAYVDEYAWRYNNRHLQGSMFDLLLKQVIEVRTVKL